MAGTKLFASDFDGTLNFHDGTPIREGDRHAIAAFRAAGGLFGVCTGRSYGALTGEVEDLVTLDFVIADSGATIYDQAGSLMFERALPPDVAGELWDRYHGRSTWGGVVSTAGQYYGVSPLRGDALGWVRSVPSFSAMPLPIHGVSFGTETVGESTEMAAEVNHRFAGAVIAHQNLNSIDIVPDGCTKGTGVEHVRGLFGACMVGGIGDSFNDLPLLAAADRAYTFSDAVGELRAEADVLVHSVAEALADFMACLPAPLMEP